MKNSITTLTIAISLIAFSNLSAVSNDTEQRLIEQVIMEGAVTPGQKNAASKYFSNLAQAKKQEADKFRSMAKVGRGGKSRSQELKSQELLQKAEELDKQSEYYQKTSVSAGTETKTNIALN